jgi:L,D-transpeptidase catalytic domain
MCTSLNQLMRIALLLTAIDAAWVLFPVTAHAGPGYRRAVDAGAAGAQRVAVLVTIDKTRQQMTVSVNGVERYEWPVSTGRAGYSTPSGTYTATSMNEIWYSKQWDNSPMPHSVFFIKDGHAIHGSYDVKNLGRPVSHGCVRIAPKNAATLYALVGENGLGNTQVVVTGVTPGGEYNDAADEASPRGEYKVARGQTSPRWVRRSSGVPYYNGSQGYYGYNGSQGYNGSPWPWTLPHW